MWTNVEMLGVEDMGERGIRVHVLYSAEDGSAPIESQIDIPPGSSADFFDTAVQTALDHLNDKDALISALKSLPVGAYTLGAVTQSVQTAQLSLGLKTGGASNAPATS